MKKLLKNIYKKWMKVAKVISSIITKILLVVTYYSIFLLYGVVIRLLRIDLCDQKINKSGSSYYSCYGKEIKPLKKEAYLRQF